MNQIDSTFQLESCLEKQYSKCNRGQYHQELINNTIQSFEQFLYENELAEMNTKILLFGSILNGFSTKISDIDFTITTNSYISEVQGLEYWVSQLKKQSRFKIYSNLLNCRVPVLKILDQENLINIDLCYNNLFGAINTRLLNAYSKLDEKVKKGGILLKMWAKGAKIITNQLFSSYSILILWLHFLQENYHLPNLQNQKYNIDAIESDLIIKRTIYKEENITKITTFFLYEGETYEKKQLKFQKRISKTSLVTLIQKFFYYYSQEGYGFNQSYKISINQKIKKDLGIKYSMSDPFDPLHDPLIKINKVFANNKAFDNAVLYFKSQQDIEYLFLENNQQIAY